MKANRLMFSVAMLVSFSVVAKAKKEKGDLISRDTTCYKILYSTQGEQIRIGIYNEDGDLISSEQVSYATLYGAVNLSNLQPGKYCLEVVPEEARTLGYTVYQVECYIRSLNSSDRIVSITSEQSGERIVLSVSKLAAKNFVVEIYDATVGLKHSETLLV